MIPDHTKGMLPQDWYIKNESYSFNPTTDLSEDGWRYEVTLYANGHKTIKDLFTNNTVTKQIKTNNAMIKTVSTTTGREVYAEMNCNGLNKVYISKEGWDDIMADHLDFDVRVDKWIASFTYSELWHRVTLEQIGGEQISGKFYCLAV